MFLCDFRIIFGEEKYKEFEEWLRGQTIIQAPYPLDGKPRVYAYPQDVSRFFNNLPTTD